MFLKSSFLVLVATCAAVLAQDATEYENEWQGELDFECERHQIIKEIKSIHSNKEDDRLFSFTCTQAPSSATPGKCEWSHDYVNEWYEPVTYVCPPNMLMAGVKSEYRKKSEDRRMRFKCCKDSGVLTYSCDLTDYLNEYDMEVGYNVRNGWGLAGWFSVFSEKKSDRRHKMLECRYR